MIRCFLVALACLMSFSFASQAQTTRPGHAFEHAWKKADSFLNSGLPQSAEKIVQDILKEADVMQDKPNVIKAKLTLMLLENTYTESTLPDNINKAIVEIANSSGAEKAIWQSITAGMYWQYYRNNRWKILNRSTLEQTVSDDIATWDAKAFVAQTGEYYLASVANGEVLKSISVEQYLPLIVKGEHTRHLRPTLYDLLAFRAIEFFSNDEKDITDPVYRFEIDEDRYFAPAAVFAQMPLVAADSQSLHWSALRLYQDIIAFHQKDSRPDALIDADMQRLKFVYDHAVSEDKDSLYVRALRHLSEQYDGNSLVAQADYLTAVISHGVEVRSATYYRYASFADEQLKSVKDLPRLKSELERIRSKYPKTEGSWNSGKLLQSIEEQYMEIKTESVSLPEVYLKAFARYRNMDSAFVHLYRISANEFYDKDIDDSTQIPLHKWVLKLPGEKDFKQHTTEFKIDPLPLGFYALIVTDHSDQDDSDVYVENYFQVSNIAAVGITDYNYDRDKGYLQYGIVNRKSGAMLQHVTVDYGSFSKKKNQVKWSSEYKRYSDNNGLVFIDYKQAKDLYSTDDLIISRENDSLYVNLGRESRIADINELYEPDQFEVHQRYFLFTDRSIYRPGQKIYFKAIAVKSNYDNSSNEVVPNDTARIYFTDVNGQKTDSLQLVTNEYGSISGSFIAPETGLTGRMTIYIGNNRWENTVSVNVEEYKRPKFYVTFDTLRNSYALDDKISVSGHAKSFAGTAISNATVKYSVKREANIPYLWQYYSSIRPNSPVLEITSGTITTDENGKFELEFTAMPDKSIDKKIQPVFNFTVNADITDINGETRQGNTHIALGYTDWKIVADISNAGLGKHTDSLYIVAQNLNGVDIPATLSLKISRLKPLDRLYRTRTWDTLTDYMMSYEEFRQYFPDDEYKDETNVLKRPVEKVVWDKTFTTTEEGILPIDHDLVATPGFYMFETEGKDSKGNRVYDRQYKYVLPKRNDDVGFEMPMLLTGNRNAGQPGDRYYIELRTQHPEAALLMYQYDTLSVLRKNKIDRIISEKDKGGIAYYFCYVYNNRIYGSEYKISVPWTDKELKIEWATHRDKLLPGAQEEWTMTIKGHNKDKVAAELLAGMYDASLDAILPQKWDWNKLYAAKNNYKQWGGLGFDNTSEYDRSLRIYDSIVFNKSYDELAGYRYDYISVAKENFVGAASVVVSAIAAPGIQVTNAGGQPGAASSLRIRGVGSLSADQAPLYVIDGVPYEGDLSSINPNDIAEAMILKDASATELYGSRGANGVLIIKTKTGGKKQEEIVPRKNLQETAFFFPQLQTDSSGNISFRFTMPEALTEWKMMAFAHTKDWKTGYLEGKVKTQKDLMVMPNLPRFFRQGDDMVITTKINSLADLDLNGSAVLEILNAETLQPLDLPFRLQNKEQHFSVAPRQSAAVSWNVHIPESIYTPVIVRVKAQAGNFTDGEENTLPVITNRMLVAETLPLLLHGNEEKVFNLDQLKNANSNTLVHRALTLEFTGNPAWYAVQALPYLMEYPHECAEQTFNRYYAHALAAHIIAQSPKIKAVFDQWKNEDTAALLSNLAKNQELKSALLEETPWVLEAKNETEQRHRIALLFETHRLATSMNKNMDQLAQMQLPEGGFPWFRGMTSSRYITQYIITGLARLQQLGLRNSDQKVIQNIIDKALPYLDRELKNDYDGLVRYKAKLQEQHIGYEQIQYLYMRSFYPQIAIDKGAEKAFAYYRNQAVQYHSRLNPYLKGMLALALHRMKDKKTTQDIMASLKETAVHHEEMGMYWKDMPHGYYWYQAPVEAQALLMEAFHEIAQDNNAVDEMKTWLLMQKQTQHWPSTKATADACYALLLSGNNWLAYEPEVTIHLGQHKTIRSSEVETAAGTGYFKTVVAGKDVLPEMGTITVKTEYSASAQQGTAPPSWGAVYWQYFEDMDKITAAATPLSLSKQLFIERQTDKGPVLTEIKEGNSLKVGDKVKVRMVLKTDRDMEFVHLKDSRGACFEPSDVLSGYRYQNGLGYYESTKDVSTNFFFDRLPKGTHVLEYTVFVNQKGTFSNGIATLQCMYAPEFSSHTEGLRFRVE